MKLILRPSSYTTFKRNNLEAMADSVRLIPLEHGAERQWRVRGGDKLQLIEKCK